VIQLVVFTLEEQRYALPLAAVDRIVRAVESTPLPQAPPIVLGVLSVEGRVVPLVDIRKRFRLPERDIGLNDQLILAFTSRRPVALLVDAVSGVLEHPAADVVAPEAICPGLEHVEGVVALNDGIILIHDLDKFLALEETQALDAALERV